MTGAPQAEEWRPIPWIVDCYEVSNLGRVRSMARRTPRILKPYPDKDGYPVIALWKRPIRRQANVHRLVAEMFLADKKNALHCEVAHLDGDRKNCRADNLKWVSKVENQSHKLAHGTHLAGERHPQAKLTEKDVLAIRASGDSLRKLASAFGVSTYTIDDIKRNRRWRHVR